ncbi:ATPase, T2SS/T4P/T4SS family [Rhodopirellula sp. MGV]|uniref:ATPase, T2SS/T4P/T4SS family n=1 Tax=Rhodopirellula sp. MGV TaxID=2023130 RepID=UPI000B974F33|nr:ATPase, T2SS/T4P/T4SS family [Rhodopirellula sp. MGV]OYP38809.1 general secretion pathway protein GspE [Rhodopirellula sp. MGV]PNY37621.1 general secretion pathway protein GspE [Rhodopirellula baltica]
MPQDVQPQLWQSVAPVEFTPKLNDNSQAQALLIGARQGAGFAIAAGQVSHAIQSRATQVLFDFTAAGSTIRYMIDGQWEQLPPLDRESADAMLITLKQLCLMNPADRRSAQSGAVKAKLKKEKYEVLLQSQGVPTGERVLMRLEAQQVPFETLSDLGMRDKMVATLKQHLNSDGDIALLTAPKGEGLTTSWNIAIGAADRLVRDFQSFEEQSRPEPEIININPNFYGGSTGLTPYEALRKAILKEPDVYMFPDPVDGETFSMALDQVENLDKKIVTRMVSSNAVEGFARLVAQYADQRQRIASRVACVLGQRLVRRLCDNCKIGFQPPPQLLQQLGIPPGRVALLYQPFIPPPPEQQVDENGRPAPITPCPVCHGRGYFGRIAIFELLIPGPQLRDAITKTQDMGRLNGIAKSEGFHGVQTEAVLTVARGLTSLDELKRAFAKKA